MPSYSIFKFTILPGPLRVSAEFLILSTGPLCHAIDIAIAHQPNMPQMQFICHEICRRTGKRTTAAVAKALDRAAKDIWQNGNREALHQYWIEDPPNAKELICLISAKLWAER